MAKLNHKGFSMVELIIAIAVFTMLAIPIIRQLLTSVNMNSRARTTQKTAEYAEYLMEYMKSTPIDEVGKGEIFSDLLQDAAESGTTEESVGGTTVTYSKLQYKIDSVTINNQTYSAVVDMDTKDYAVRKALDPDAVNPNAVNVGSLKNVDASSVAVIAGQASNNDTSAERSIFALKTEQLKDKQYDAWEQLMYGDYNPFADDSVRKVTTVKMSKKGSGGKNKYTVECNVSYKDQNLTYPTDTMNYTLTPQVFEQQEPPVIFLMYNPCIYNNEYMPYDYIVLDLSGMDPTDNVKMYLIETATALNYDSDYRDNYPSKDTGETDDEYKAKVKQYAEEYMKTHPASVRAIMDASGITYYNESLIPDVNETYMSRDNVFTYFNIRLPSQNGVPVNREDYLKGKYLNVYTNMALDRVKWHLKFDAIMSSLGLNDDVVALGEDTWVEGLDKDVVYEDVLWSMKVTLYDASGKEVVSYSGTKGAE
ncbi:MAG: prepilin-type N-terminal cleavage/methylation domain-containing protein [Lachnospiraceae bacterium]|nr:prepilin-type N-terminal cleavage/methylation domain-containing protein [Lachnospiraceae bacterium]